MPIISNLQSLQHDAVITLFRLTGYNVSAPNESFFFTNNIGVAFEGRSYNPVPCEITGLDITSEGALPRPTLTIADPATEGGAFLISSLIRLYGGLEGAKLDFSVTTKNYLDGQPDAGQNAIALYDSYVVSQRIREIPGKIIEFELSSAIDFVEEVLPSRHCIKKCPWRYRGNECGYTGSQGYTLSNTRTADPKLDQCSKTVTACTKRFGRRAVLPFGGFPALLR